MKQGRKLQDGESVPVEYPAPIKQLTGITIKLGSGGVRKVDIRGVPTLPGFHKDADGTSFGSIDCYEPGSITLWIEAEEFPKDLADRLKIMFGPDFGQIAIDRLVRTGQTKAIEDLLA